MTKIFHPLLALIASATDRELAKYVEYLKEENKILRARIPGEIHTKPEERKRLIKLGKSLGRAIEELISIVTPGTFYRWLRNEKSEPKTKNPKGGQRKPKEIRELVIQIAKTTGFGYTRIIGELRKLGIKKISRQTVRNILKEEGIEPGPDRTSDCWDNFVKRHAETLWGCDFFSVKTVTKRGLRDMYVLVFLCLETREAIVSTGTEHPNSAWVVKQTENFLDQTTNREKKPSIVMFDRDTKFPDMNEFYLTATHELLHWSGAETRLNRKGLSYGFEELVAEIGAAYCCTEIGIPISNNMTGVTSYIKGWLSAIKEDPGFIFRASSHASKAADFLLGHLESETAEEPEPALTA